MICDPAVCDYTYAEIVLAGPLLHGQSQVHIVKTMYSSLCKPEVCFALSTEAVLQTDIQVIKTFLALRMTQLQGINLWVSFNL